MKALIANRLSFRCSCSCDFQIGFFVQFLGLLSAESRLLRPAASRPWPWRRGEWNWRVRMTRCSRWRSRSRLNHRPWRTWSRTRAWIIRFRSPTSPARFWPRWSSIVSTMSITRRPATTSLLRRRTKSRPGTWISWRWIRPHCSILSW